MEKKGVSPIMATVLLIAVTLMLGGIIYLWSSGFVEEGFQKNGKAAESTCKDIVFEAGITGTAPNNILEVNNQGNVPLYGFTIKVVGDGTLTVDEDLSHTIGIGESAQIDISDQGHAKDTKLLIVPRVLAKQGGSKVAFTCDDDMGLEIVVP